VHRAFTTTSSCAAGTARREILIEELLSDDCRADVVLIHEAEGSPADDRVDFVRGSTTNEADLRRARIATAASAIVCPADGLDEADLHSILTVLAIEHIAPRVRTVAEVNNPSHVDTSAVPASTRFW